jgi:hypothetical protein
MLKRRQLEITEKRCARCTELKSVEGWIKSDRWSDGFYPYCPACKSDKAKEFYAMHSEKIKARVGQHREDNIDKVHEYDIKRKAAERDADPEAFRLKKRRYELMRNFGITLEQYNELLEKQEGVCFICSKHPDEERKALAVDHNHTTGEIRGILCYRCNNRIIGRHTDPALLHRAAEYLTQQGSGLFVPKHKKRPRRPRKVKSSG